MLSKLRDLKVILAILLLLSWVITGVFFYVYKSNVDSQIASQAEEIESLNVSLTEIGELVPAYVVVSDVVSGKPIEESDLELIEVPLSMSTNLANDIDELTGKHFKIGLTTGTVVTTDCVYEEIITSDMRYYDMMVDVVPIGLKPGAFVDVRIKFGTGADFIGVAHRQVAKVNGNAIKLIVTEQDIHMFSTMLIENIIFNEKLKDAEGKSLDAVGAYIYAIEYVDGGVQDKAGEYFAPSMLVQAIMQGDPNMLSRNDYSPNDLVLKRKLIEAGLPTTDATASKVRDVVQKVIEDGRKLYEKALEAELKAQQE